MSTLVQRRQVLSLWHVTESPFRASSLIPRRWVGRATRRAPESGPGGAAGIFRSEDLDEDAVGPDKMVAAASGLADRAAVPDHLTGETRSTPVSGPP